MNQDKIELENIIKRLKEAAKVTTDTALAEKLEIGKGNVYIARQKNHIPPGWFFKISEKTGYSSDYLKKGKEPKKLKEYIKKEDQKKHPIVKAQNATYSKNGGYRPGEIKVSIEIKKAIDILESKTVYSNALMANIEAFYNALEVEKKHSECLGRIQELEKRLFEIEKKLEPEPEPEPEIDPEKV